MSTPQHQPVPVSVDKLRIGQALPFTLLDEEGRVLLAKGLRIEDEHQLALIRSRRRVFVPFEESELALKILMQGLLEVEARRAPIKDIEKYALASEEEAEAESEPLQGTFAEQCAEVTGRLRRLLAGIAQGSLQGEDALRRLRLWWADLRQWDRTPGAMDAAGMVLTVRVVTEPSDYCVLHATQCAVLALKVASRLGWDAARVRSLVLATATMNVAMLKLQDQLALQREPPSAAQRALIDTHAAEGELMLRRAGVTDEVWLQAVRLHHAALAPGVPLAQRPPAQALAHVIQVLDRYTASMSPRASRPGRGARESARLAVYFRSGGERDEVGTALLALLGLYPPGTFVRLKGGELALVLRPGAKAATPIAAVVVNRAGEPIGTPRLVDCARPEHAVVDSVPGSSVKARINLDEMVKLLAFSRTPGSGLR
ncbi:MAG: HD-GYP domain-containing protein [Tepidimonas sp.]|uniref:HD-GYP domain-containing protein n=1 Tax=Tepidimonas sp. TaxID=2002775 RepID=UPI004054FA54